MTAAGDTTTRATQAHLAVGTVDTRLEGSLLASFTDYGGHGGGGGGPGLANEAELQLWCPAWLVRSLSA